MARSGTKVLTSQLILSVALEMAAIGCDVDTMGSKYKLSALPAAANPVSAEATPVTIEAAVDQKSDQGTNDSGNVPSTTASEIVSVESPQVSNTITLPIPTPVPVPAEGTTTTLKIVTDSVNLVEGTAVTIGAVLSATLGSKANFVWSISPVDPTATEGAAADFSVIQGAFSINLGSLSGQIEILAFNDFIVEGVENFDLKITEPTLKMESHLIFSVADGKPYIKGQIAGGDKNACAIKAGGLLCWGANAEGELGVGDRSLRPAATAVLGMTASVTFVDSQLFHACGIKSGSLYCWGRNDVGQLGDNSKSRRLSPVAVEGMTSTVSSVAVGAQHTCAIRAGALKCWGGNSVGQLGIGTTTSQRVATSVLNMTLNVTDVASGLGHTCAVQAGALYCWGANDLGQLGTGDTVSKTTATAVPNFDKDVTQVAANGKQTCAIKNSQLFCWGSNVSGQLGIGSTDASFTAPQLVGAETDIVIGVVMGLEHSCAIMNAVPFCWGRGAEGQLGNSLTGNVNVPTKVDDFGEGVGSMAAGSYHTCMVGLTKKKCWGQGANGELGDNLKTAAITPKDIVFP